MNKKIARGVCKSTTKNILHDILSQPHINRVLELGSGYGSTPLIRGYMKKNNGFCLSLESKKKWVNRLRRTIPNDEYGEIKFAPLTCSVEYGCRYDYPLSEQFDVIFIDGPASLTPEQQKYLYAYLQNCNSPLSNTRKGGSQSAALLDYVYPTMHENSIVVVDIRKLSVEHYKHQYNTVFQFTSIKDGKVTLIQNKVK